MKHFRIRRGLDLPFPYQGNLNSKSVHSISTATISGSDYPIKPNLLVEEGNSVRRGEILFSTKDNHRMGVVSPVSGKVIGIYKGAKRALVSISIQVESTESGRTNYFTKSLDGRSRSDLANYLGENGAWVYFRTRPFFEVPNIQEVPEAIIVNGMDTRPGSIGMIPLISGREKYLSKGLEAISSLTIGNVYFAESPTEDWNRIFQSVEISKGGKFDEKLRIERVLFSGKHPAGLSSTQIHFLHPASLNHRVWTIPANLVADIGELLITGILPNRTRVNLSGPYWKHPTFLDTIIGARVTTLVKDCLPDDYKDSSDIAESNYRIVSGSILHGWEARGSLDVLGRFHNQISLIRNDSKRAFLDWLLPSTTKFSITRSTFGRFFPKNVIWNTSMNGSPRALVPIGNYERVMPMDILPTQLLRALLTKDWEEAIELGALELEEEDLSLCSYVCPGKMDFGVMLKDTLKIAKKEML